MCTAYTVQYVIQFSGFNQGAIMILWLYWIIFLVWRANMLRYSIQDIIYRISYIIKIWSFKLTKMYIFPMHNCSFLTNQSRTKGFPWEKKKHRFKYADYLLQPIYFLFTPKGLFIWEAGREYGTFAGMGRFLSRLWKLFIWEAGWDVCRDETLFIPGLHENVSAW